MFTEDELIRSEVYWMERIQNDMFREMDAFIKRNEFTQEQAADASGIALADVRRLMKGEFNGTLQEAIILMLKIGRAPCFSFVDFDEAKKRDRPYEPLMQRKGRSGKYFQMQDVLLACGELNEQEMAPIRWLLKQANDMHETYEKERRS